MTASSYKVILTTPTKRSGISVPRFFCIIAYEVLVGREKLFFMKRKIFLFLAIVSVMEMITMSGCHKDDYEQNGRKGRTTGSSGGHDWVDLGLPSGTRWATCNVGANSPEDYGDYFAWGETTLKNNYTWGTYRYCTADYNSEFNFYTNIVLTKYNATDGKTILDASDDAATANWGHRWRMPTYDEFNELLTNCITTFTAQNGVNGILFIGPNENSIFFPNAGGHSGFVPNADGYSGYYLSSSLASESPNNIWLLYIHSNNFGLTNLATRYNGSSVRPVRNQ